MKYFLKMKNFYQGLRPGILVPKYLAAYTASRIQLLKSITEPEIVTSTSIPAKPEYKNRFYLPIFLQQQPRISDPQVILPLSSIGDQKITQRSSRQQP